VNKEKGFTLIELLVVIIILGILLAVAIPRYFEGIQQAKIKNYCSVISGIKMAIETYRTTNAPVYAFPAPPDNTVTLKDWITNTWHRNFNDYFDKEPRDPWNNNLFKITGDPNELQTALSNEDPSIILYKANGTHPATYTLEFLYPLKDGTWTTTTTCP